MIDYPASGKQRKGRGFPTKKKAKKAKERYTKLKVFKTKLKDNDNG